MVYANIEIRNPPPKTATKDLGRQKGDESTGVSGRIVVFAQSIKDNSFDTLLLRFRGIVLVSQQEETSIEDLITLTDVKSLAQFTTNPATGDGTVEFHFYLPINAPRLFGVNRNLPQSGIVRGHAYKASKSGWCGNQQRVEGLCEVSYWIDAEFRLQGKQVGSLTRHVEVPNFYHSHQVLIKRALYFPFRATSSWFSTLRSDRTVDLSLLLQQVDPRPTTRIETNGDQGWSLSIGLTLNALGPAGQPLPWTTRQSLKCHVTCKWEAKVSFSTSKARGRLLFNSASTTSTEHCSAFFRPETELSSPHHYVAMSELDLIVPEFIRRPSFQLGLLSRTYTLKISLGFDKLGEMVLPQVQGTFSLTVNPVHVCTGTIRDEVAFDGEPDVSPQHNVELTKEVTRSTSPLPIYC